jgi:tetratricopeptide (TPR) repeat protein
MKRLFGILVFVCLATSVKSQEDTHIIDSLQNVLATQEGREKVLTMIELTWEFYEISYDDCLDWGEKAIKEANVLGYKDLEAKANYVLGIQYAYHADLDLAEEYLQNSYNQFVALSDTKNAFEALWNIATYELTLGSIDTAYIMYERALPLAEKMNDISAYADIVSNMGLIEYKRCQMEESYRLYDRARRMYETIGDERKVLRIKDNMAVICTDWGHAEEARQLYWEVIPKLEQLEEYYHLLAVCKNMGAIYENDLVNYDSSMYYFQKALDYAEKPMNHKETRLLADNEKSGTLVAMANLMLKRGDVEGAIGKYGEALELARGNGYVYGQLESYLGLGTVYSQLGQASKSMRYIDCFFELENTSGITAMHQAVRKPLVMNYARLRLYDQLEKEFNGFEEEINGLVRENADVYVQNQDLRHDVENLLGQHEFQNEQIKTLQTQCNHYRLAFFGLLAIMLFVVVLLVAYKIVRKNRIKV